MDEESDRDFPDADANVQRCIFGQIMTWRSRDMLHKVFFVGAMIFLVIVTSFTGWAIYDGNRNEMSGKPSDFVLALVILTNEVFCLYYVFSAIFREKKFDLVVLIISYVILLVYCCADYGIKYENIKQDSTRYGVKTARLVLVCVGLIPFLVMSALVLRSYGYFAFNVVGSDPLIQRLFTRFEMFTSILLIDLQLATSLLVLVIVNSSLSFVDPAEKITLGIGVPFVFMLALVGYFAARYENKIAMILFEVLSVSIFGYIIYKIYVIDRHNCLIHTTTSSDSSTSSYSTSPSSSSTSSYSTTPKDFCYSPLLMMVTSATVFLYAVSHTLVMVFSILVHLGFQKGLKEKLSENDGSFSDRLVNAVRS